MQNSVKQNVKNFLIEYSSKYSIEEYKEWVWKKVDSIVYVRKDLEVSMKELWLEEDTHISLKKVFDISNWVSWLQEWDKIWWVIKSASVNNWIEFLKWGYITNIQNIYIWSWWENIYIETENSIYLLEALVKSLKTHQINLSDGYIQLPEWINKIHPKTEESITEKWLCWDSLHIDMGELNKYMFSVNGSELFTTFSGRVYCLIKVWSIHVAYYTSSSGTGGKIENKWYPAFWVDKQNWIIKWWINKETKNMDYSVLLDYFSTLLNKHFHIPEQVYLTWSWKHWYNVHWKWFVESFDLSNYFNVKDIWSSKDILETFWYFPWDNISRGNWSDKWINEIVSNI
jgi:hypothetical protein